MTNKKKIAESIEVRVSLPEKYEHIIMTKYAEKEIEYDSAEEMEKKESELNDELVDSLIRDMRALPARLGKKTEAVQEVEERIKGKLPDWLESEHVPNLAQKTHDRAVDSQQANKEKQEPKIGEAKEAVEPANNDIVNDDALFENFDQDAVSEKVAEPQKESPVEESAESTKNVTEEVVVPEKTEHKGDLDDWEEDLFSDK